jgi:hypothetical protein
MPGFSKCSLSLTFPHQNPVYTTALSHTCYMHRPIILFDLMTRVCHKVTMTKLMIIKKTPCRYRGTQNQMISTGILL